MKHVRGEREECGGREGGTGEVRRARASAQKKKKQRQRRKKARAKKETRDERARPERKGGRGEYEAEERGWRGAWLAGNFFPRKTFSMRIFSRARTEPPANTRPHLRAYPPCTRERDGEKGSGGEKDKRMKKSGRACGCAGGWRDSQRSRERVRRVEREGGRIREKTDKRRKNGQWKKGGGGGGRVRAGVRVKAPSVHVRETLWSVRTCTPSRARREKEEESRGGRKSEREGLRATR